MRPHRRQPTRLPRAWDSPGKNTGVGCHFLLQCMKVTSQSEVTQSCLTLGDLMDCSLPGSSVHGIFQARVLEWGAIAFSRSQHYNILIAIDFISFKFKKYEPSSFVLFQSCFDCFKLFAFPYKCLESVCQLLRLLLFSPIRRRQWNPTLVLLPGKSHGWRSLEGSSPWGC